VIPEDFETDRYLTAEELLKALQERADDFDGVTIAVPEKMLLKGPQGRRIVVENVCGSISLCNGRKLLIHREDLEILLNNGIIQRLGIPISVSPT